MSQMLLAESATVVRRSRPTVSAVPAQFTCTVPKEYVHRAAVAEVFLTSWGRLDDTRFAISAQWPRGHSFYRSADGVHLDPMLFAETIRQCGSLLSHAEFDVPLGHHFLMSELSCGVELDQLVRTDVPTDLELSVRCHDVQLRRGRLNGMAYEVELRHDGRLVGTGGARFTCTAPAVYQRLRGDRLTCRGPVAPLPPAVPAWLVGRQDAADVVLAPAGGSRRWLLRTDVRHPILFDHPGDHVPGMVLLEAARQAACTLYPAAVAPDVVRASFQRYVEFDDECWLTAEKGGVDDLGRSTIRVRAVQNGEVAFSCDIATPAFG